MPALLGRYGPSPQAYTDWGNGDIYGSVVETWRRNGESVERTDEQVGWGHIGMTAALAHLRDDMLGGDVREPGPQPVPQSAPRP